MSILLTRFTLITAILVSVWEQGEVDSQARPLCKSLYFIIHRPNLYIRMQQKHTRKMSSKQSPRLNYSPQPKRVWHQHSLLIICLHNDSGGGKATSSHHSLRSFVLNHSLCIGTRNTVLFRVYNFPVPVALHVAKNMFGS